LALLLAAESLAEGDPERRTRVEEAITALEEGLQRTPANAYAWARLAYQPVDEVRRLGLPGAVRAWAGT
jgi:cytochrome c-type biogenesis protein CcmH/NrfG